MSRGMTRQRDELHAVDDWLGASKRVPLTGLEVRRCDGLRTPEERPRILRRLSSDFGRQPKVAFGLRDVNVGIWKDAFSECRRDRKSTRLNSSHLGISYAVFCLKKKKMSAKLISVSFPLLGSARHEPAAA